MSMLRNGLRYKVAAFLAIAGLVLTLQFAGEGTKRTSVPWLLGLPQAKAKERLDDRALRAEVIERAGAQKLPPRYREKGRIVFQDYRRGIVLPTGTAVRVMVYGRPVAKARD